MLRVRVRRRLPGFTLVELLVVIAIIGIWSHYCCQLSRPRAKPRRMQCGNNLKQIALSAHNFHDVYKRMPPGYLGTVDQTTREPCVGQTGENCAAVGGPQGTTCQAVCGLVYLLPYMEQSPLYDQISAVMELDVNQAPMPTTSTSGKRTLNWFGSAAIISAQGTGLATTKVAPFVCPSAPTRPGTGGILLYMPTHVTPSNPTGSMTISGWIFGPGTLWTNALGRTNYFLCMGGAGFERPENNGWSPYPGYFWSRTKTNFGENVDGTSNTFLVGESPGGYAQTSGAACVAGLPCTKQFDHAWFGAGALPTAWGPPPANGMNIWPQYGSFHPGTIQYGFADGAVRPIAMTVTRNDTIFVSGRKDGRQYDTNAFQ